MKIRSQKREINLVTLEAEASQEEFQQTVEQSLKHAARQIKLPGFRPGKAPKDLVEKSLDREALESQAVQELISGLYPNIIKEAKLAPVDYPKIEILEQKKGQPIVFSLAVEVYPEVKLGKYKGLRVGKKNVENADADVKNQLVAAAAAEAKVDIPGAMTEREVGLMVDELKASLAQSGLTLENYLKGIKKEETSLREEFKKSAEISLMLDELKASLSQSGLTLEDYLKGIKKEISSLRQEFKKSAEIRVKGKVALKAVAEEEKLAVSDEEMKSELRAMAESAGEELDQLNKRLDEGAREYIEDYLLRRKALAFILEKAKITEIKGEQK